MTRSLRSGPRHALGPWTVGALLLACHLGAPAHAPAQGAAGLSLLLSDQPKDAKPKAPGENPRHNYLRPNVVQELFTYVKNDGTEDRKVTVQVLASGTVAAAQEVPVGAGAVAEVRWPRPAGAAPGKEPALAELEGPVTLRLLAGGKPVGTEVPVEVDRPASYVTPEKVTFYPGEGGKNRLVVTLSPRAGQFKGPPCRVELVLRPDRIPGLVAGQPKKGRHVGFLTPTTKKLYLTAEDVQLREGASGLVYLTVDGVERAFTFWTTFAPGATPSSGQQVSRRALALRAAPLSVPTAKYPVGVEADDFDNDLPRTARIKLEVFTPVPEGESEEDGWSELAEFRGERRRRLSFAAGGPRGGLLFRPEVKDWAREVDLSEAQGRTRLRLRVLDDKGDPVRVLDKEALARAGAGEAADLKAELAKTVAGVTHTVVLDGTAPEGVAFRKPPARAVRGKPLALLAAGADGESEIRDVVFYLGKALPGGKVPPDAVRAPGRRGAKGEKLWAAALPVAKDEKAPLPVTVVFTNGVGLTKTATLTLDVADPPPPPAKKKASIAGAVVEGDRPQAGLTVQLSDAGGKPLKTTKTDKDGVFVFEGLEPGDYTVSASKSASRTRGQAKVVGLKGGEQKKDVQVELYR